MVALHMASMVQIENSASGDSTDEHYAYVKGDFGKVIVGGENAVADLMTVSAPKVPWLENL